MKALRNSGRAICLIVFAIAAMSLAAGPGAAGPDDLKDDLVFKPVNPW